jgi:biopolymer transport protein ExbD
MAFLDIMLVMLTIIIMVGAPLATASTKLGLPRLRQTPPCRNRSMLPCPTLEP